MGAQADTHAPPFELVRVLRVRGVRGERAERGERGGERRERRERVCVRYVPAISNGL